MPDPRLSRQAVFDRNLSVYGYEVFLRDGDEDLLVGPSADQAGARAIERSVNTVGLTSLTGGKKAFFSVTRRMLAEDLATLLPPRQTVIEILRTLEPNEAVVARCQELKKKGYQVAVDAYTARRGMAPLMALADIVRIDFRSTDAAEQESGAKRYGRPNVQVLAEGIESHQDLDRARRLGYALYQGFFFCKPQDVSRKEIPAFKLNYLRMLQEINRPEADFDVLEAIIRQDMALSLKLLRYVNSAAFGLPRRVESIRQAMTMVGVNVMRRWVSLLALAAMSEDKPQELIVTSLVRARFCEQIGLAAGIRNADFDLFMMGLLSLIDAVLDQPLKELLPDLPVSPEVKGALSGATGGLGPVLALATAYERAEWDRLPLAMGSLNLDVMKLPALYREALAWVEQIFIP